MYEKAGVALWSNEWLGAVEIFTKHSSLLPFLPIEADSESEENHPQSYIHGAVLGTDHRSHEEQDRRNKPQESDS
ncbi:MAG: hypothetical protein AB1757_29920 [Acidobacteriota bacterium]